LTSPKKHITYPCQWHQGCPVPNLEVFGYAFSQQDFLIKGFVSWPSHHALCSVLYAPYPMRHALLPVLPDPPNKSVTGWPYQNVLTGLAKEETFGAAFSGFKHKNILSWQAVGKHRHSEADGDLQIIEVIHALYERT
jgi:hypothetical protein